MADGKGGRGAGRGATGSVAAAERERAAAMGIPFTFTRTPEQLEAQGMMSQDPLVRKYTMQPGTVSTDWFFALRDTVQRHPNADEAVQRMANGIARSAKVIDRNPRRTIITVDGPGMYEAEVTPRGLRVVRTRITRGPGVRVGVVPDEAAAIDLVRQDVVNTVWKEAKRMDQYARFSRARLASETRRLPWTRGAGGVLTTEFVGRDNTQSRPTHERVTITPLPQRNHYSITVSAAGATPGYATGLRAAKRVAQEALYLYATPRNGAITPVR